MGLRLRRPQRRASHALGQSLAEFALSIPVMMLILLLTIDFGRLLFSYIQVTNAAREAAAVAVINPTHQADINAAAVRETNVQSQRGENSLAVAVACTDSTTQATVSCSSAPSAGLGSQVTVTVSERFSLLTPLIGGMLPNLTLASSATGFFMSPVKSAASQTPAPTPTPSPSASPTPTSSPELCIVPDFRGMHADDPAIPTRWQNAGFQASNLTNTQKGNGLVNGQSLGAGTSQSCDSSITLN